MSSPSGLDLGTYDQTTNGNRTEGHRGVFRGTAATFGRYLRLRGTSTKLCVVDPEGSDLHPFDRGQTGDGTASRIEGIGRPRVEPSFVPSVVDRMLGVPDGASVATMRFLRNRLGIFAGPSTGTNLFGALRLACE